MIVPRNSKYRRRTGDDQLATIPSGASKSSGRLVAPSTARIMARAARTTVLAVDCSGSSGRSRSTAIAGAARPSPRIRRIDGFVLIPPFMTMKGPAMRIGPTTSTPIAHHRFARGISSERNKESKMSVRQKRDG